MPNASGEVLEFPSILEEPLWDPVQAQLSDVGRPPRLNQSRRGGWLGKKKNNKKKKHTIKNKIK
jgi:hypothetical protein